MDSLKGDYPYDTNSVYSSNSDSSRDCKSCSSDFDSNDDISGTTAGRKMEQDKEGAEHDQPPSPYYSPVPTPYPVVFSTPTLIDSARSLSHSKSHSHPALLSTIPPPSQHQLTSLPLDTFEMSSSSLRRALSAPPETPQSQSQVHNITRENEDQHDSTENINPSPFRPRSVIDLAINTASGNPAGRAVRRNVLTRWRSIPRNARIFLIIHGLQSLAKVAATIAVLILEKDAPCSFLKTVIILYAIWVSIRFPFDVYVQFHPRVQGAPLTRRDILIERQDTLLTISGASFFFLANYFLFTQSACRDIAPGVYFLTLLHVILGYFVILLPVIVCLSAIVCLPQTLRVMRALDFTPVIGVKGATEEMIAAIPIVKYRKPAVSETEGEVGGNCTVVDIEGNSMDRTESESNMEAAATRSSEPNRGSPRKWTFGFFKKGKKLSTKARATGTSSSTKPATIEYLTLMDPQDAVCAICLCDYEDDEELRKMSCNHYFHKDCVDEWLRLNRNCPLCKRDIEELASGTKKITATASSAPTITSTPSPIPPMTALSPPQSAVSESIEPVAR